MFCLSCLAFLKWIAGGLPSEVAWPYTVRFRVMLIFASKATPLKNPWKLSFPPKKPHNPKNSTHTQHHIFLCSWYHCWHWCIFQHLGWYFTACSQWPLPLELSWHHLYKQYSPKWVMFPSETGEATGDCEVNMALALSWPCPCHNMKCDLPVCGNWKSLGRPWAMS